MRIVCYGELMLRLAPMGYLRFLQKPEFEATFGGGEANVAVSLANFGADATFVTKLPKNDIAESALKELRGFGVDVSHVTRGGERMGIYFVEKGASMRPSKVIYDRAHSSIAEATGQDFDWESILDGADWFHFTGITPALGGEQPDIMLQALSCAKRKGVKVSCDLNFRKKLWNNATACRVMTSLMPFVDVLIANEEDAADVFDISAKNSDVNGGKLDREGYADVARQLSARFGIDTVAITLRESLSANDNNWGAMLYENGEAHFSRQYAVRIVDRVGGGDSFGAGLIYAKLSGYGAQECVEFAVAASALKHTVEGDYNRVTKDEVKALVKGNIGGRVQR